MFLFKSIQIIINLNPYSFFVPIFDVDIKDLGNFACQETNLRLISEEMEIELGIEKIFITDNAIIKKADLIDIAKLFLMNNEEHLRDSAKKKIELEIDPDTIIKLKALINMQNIINFYVSGLPKSKSFEDYLNNIVKKNKDDFVYPIGLPELYLLAKEHKINLIIVKQFKHVYCHWITLSMGKTPIYVSFTNKKTSAFNGNIINIIYPFEDWLKTNDFYSNSYNIVYQNNWFDVILKNLGNIVKYHQVGTSTKPVNSIFIQQSNMDDLASLHALKMLSEQIAPAPQTYLIKSFNNENTNFIQKGYKELFALHNIKNVNKKSLYENGNSGPNKLKPLFDYYTWKYYETCSVFFPIINERYHDHFFNVYPFLLTIHLVLSKYPGEDRETFYRNLEQTMSKYIDYNILVQYIYSLLIKKWVIPEEWQHVKMHDFLFNLINSDLFTEIIAWASNLIICYFNNVDAINQINLVGDSEKDQYKYKLKLNNNLPFKHEYFHMLGIYPFPKEIYDKINDILELDILQTTINKRFINDDKYLEIINRYYLVEYILPGTNALISIVNDITTKTRTFNFDNLNLDQTEIELKKMVSEKLDLTIFDLAVYSYIYFKKKINTQVELHELALDLAKEVAIGECENVKIHYCEVFNHFRYGIPVKKITRIEWKETNLTKENILTESHYNTLVKETDIAFVKADNNIANMNTSDKNLFENVCNIYNLLKHRQSSLSAYLLTQNMGIFHNFFTNIVQGKLWGYNIMLVCNNLFDNFNRSQNIFNQISDKWGAENSYLYMEILPINSRQTIPKTLKIAIGDLDKDTYLNKKASILNGKC